VASAVLLRGGRRLYLVAPGGAVLREVEIGTDVATASRSMAEAWAGAGLSALRRLRDEAPAGTTIGSADPELRRHAQELGWPVEVITGVQSRPARAAVPARPIGQERAWALARARREMLRAAADPEQQLIALAREEERTERSLDREVGAATAWISEGAPPLKEHAEEWAEFREQFARHHAELLARVERSARTVVPNLSEVVGARTAARLVAAANGRASLARMSAGRLQLLGSRRRPGPHGPRFGVLFGALRSFEIPPTRSAAFARSLAALAAIAVRTDASTGRSIGAELVQRRDRRLARLRREGR
jgi:snoRNA binding domain-containing protein (fibrillarin)